VKVRRWTIASIQAYSLIGLAPSSCLHALGAILGTAMLRHATGDRRSRISAAASVIGVVLLITSCSSPSGGTSSASVTSSSPSTPTSGAPLPASSLAPIGGAYAPSIDASNFVTTIDNPYWPLRPGTTYRYEGTRGRTPQTDVEVVTRRTKQILGIPCTVVRDTVTEHGVAVERTFDWYAQDRQGNVWYMGEDSLERQHGHFVTASDSWESGVKGAQPGIIMPADPQPGEAYRQEYYPPGQALDQARVLRLDGAVTVPDGSFTGLLVTSERSPLEPQTEQKYYAPGLGEVEERVVRGHHEVFRLVSVTR
jgi:hypothetical protein